MSDERFSWTEPMLCTYNFDLNKNWFVYFDYTDQLTGQTIRKQFRGGINGFKKREQRFLEGNALKAYWKLQLKAGWNPFSRNRDLPMTKPLLIEAIDLIIKLKEANCSSRTMEAYRYITKLFKAWLQNNRLEKIFVMQFDIYQAQSYMDHLALKKGYTGRTYNDHLTVLSTFFNCMVDRNWIVKNPFRKIKKLEIQVGRNIAFSEDERQVLRDYLYAHDRPLYYFTQFIHYCFIRRSELTRLKIENIDFTNWMIIIPSAASKNKKQESVVIPASFVPVIKEMNLQQLSPEWFIFGRRLHPGAEQYINYNHISSRHNKIAKDLGINTQKGLYSWKHSGACAAYQVLNGDMYSLMRQLRHTELTTTQIYLKSLGLVDNTAIRNAVW